MTVSTSSGIDACIAIFLCLPLKIEIIKNRFVSSSLVLVEMESLTFMGLPK